MPRAGRTGTRLGCPVPMVRRRKTLSIAMDSSPALQRSATRGRTLASIRGLCAAASLTFAVGAFAASEPSLINGQKKSYGYSWQDEIKLGAEADKEITESMGLYDNPQLQAYV